jgi:hypothetical protein
LRRHVGDDEIENSIELIGLEDKHLVTNTSIPYEFFLVGLNVSG